MTGAGISGVLFAASLVLVSACASVQPPVSDETCEPCVTIATGPEAEFDFYSQILTILNRLYLDGKQPYVSLTRDFGQRDGARFVVAPAFDPVIMVTLQNMSEPQLEPKGSRREFAELRVVRGRSSRELLSAIDGVTKSEVFVEVWAEELSRADSQRLLDEAALADVEWGSSEYACEDGITIFGEELRGGEHTIVDFHVCDGAAYDALKARFSGLLTRAEQMDQKIATDLTATFSRYE
ncbi:hypothetical protein HK107_06290 [Parvularcula sp. ZS-1/3]|uniref:Uncharacterized protein n=1 Tax=Parvularcula mediterranea TaxID=2732508 RepID=A0A7Y3RKW5_9PROT|nr:hypothetical protein [Parvularcula mediterranea]NNU15931.1 hypothetical protein [Parvularcula mediterranea]